MSTKLPFIDLAEWYHRALVDYLAALTAGTADQAATSAFGVIAGIYQISISEENADANRRHQEFAMRHFERQTIALERIAKALEQPAP
jgi:hypothetical protein